MPFTPKAILDFATSAPAHETAVSKLFGNTLG
jgi:hypothetical protein